MSYMSRVNELRPAPFFIMSIRGIGVDTVSIERIAHAMRQPRFMERILAPSERKHQPTAQWLAGRWAAKEALYKAVGELQWHDIEVRSGKSGKPEIAILRPDHPCSACRIHLSISHDNGSAVAFVVVEDAD